MEYLKEKQNREKLFRLIQENPELPVISMVDCDIVPDDGFQWWLGSWGYSEINQFILVGGKILFKDDDEEEILTAIHGYEWVGNATDEEWDTAYENVQWITAIIVYIVLPEI